MKTNLAKSLPAWLAVTAVLVAGLGASSESSSASAGHGACLASAHAACIDNRTIVRNTVASGKATECQITGDGRLSCWGNNSDGQAIAPSGSTFASVALGGYHGCAIKNDNSVVCWGDNHFRQSTVGGGTCSPNYNDSTPTNICPEAAVGPHPVYAIDVSAGKFHTCAIRTSEQVICWGLNVDMEGRPAGQSTPPNGDFIRVSAGGYHTCALAKDTSISCWGGNWDLQTEAPSGTGFKQIAAGRTHTCALRTSGSIVCWGLSTNGRATPPSGTGYKAIAAGYDHTCAIRSNNSIVCWGANNLGQRNAPSGSFSALSVGGNSGIARRTDGVVVGWGDDSEGQATPPTGSAIGGPSVTMGMLRGLGTGRWKVSIYSTSGTKPNIKVQISTARTIPSNTTASTGAVAFASTVSWSGARPTWVRICDSVGRWSAWAPIQPQLAT